MASEKPPGDEHDRDESEEPESAEDTGDGPRIPDSDLDAYEIKRYMVADQDASLKVRVSGGEVQRRYAPARLVGELADYVAQLVEGFNGGKTMLYGLVPGQSMVLYFGDPRPDDPQEELPITQTKVAAQLVSELMELEPDELFARALEIGPRIESYDNLARFVVSQGVTLDWTPAGQPTRVLGPERARQHHHRLNVEPELQEREMTINGVLYRVIEDPVAKRGRIGIGMFNWSPEPPGYKVPGKVLLDFEGERLQRQIEGLLGEAVEATIRVRTPRVGSSVDLERVELELLRIEAGEGDIAAYGMPLFDPTES